MNVLNTMRVLAGLDPLTEGSSVNDSYDGYLKEKTNEQLEWLIENCNFAMRICDGDLKEKYRKICKHAKQEIKDKKSNKNKIVKYVTKLQQQDESVENYNVDVIDTDENTSNKIISEHTQSTLQDDVIEGKKQTETVPTIEFENKPAFTSDDFEKIVTNFVNDVNSVRDDKQVSVSIKYKTPRDVIKACNDRIKEIEDSIALDDNKGYNDQSDKVVAIEAIQHILDNLLKNNQEGYKQAVLYYSSLASNLQHWLPSHLIKYLHQG